MPAIVVLVKHVPDTWSQKALEADNTLDRVNVDSVIDEINEFAMEQALQLRDDNPDAGYRVIALTVGAAGADETLRKALAMGADDAVHILDDAIAGSDLLGTTWVLTNAINTVGDVALIVAGNASSDGAMGALPGILAEYRQVPALTNVRSVALQGQTIAAVRETAEGRFELSAQLPAIVSVTDKAPKPRFPNFKGLMAAKKHDVTVLDLAAIGVAPEQVGLAHAATAVTAANTRPARGSGDVINGSDGTAAAGTVAEFLAAEKFL
ncbi:electron transfer flavoprotein subunit beta/FixA family protein [Corynebacterium sp. YIM 101645]|uniref:Electron transfer flavoprotein subunit beta n=1 Tax=Corynebacterium lemuris TaxID=1859292 RepID=A0ABT2FW45_9CORY|nr:electron transfer flavoprotein subunit beta/FixA family protein [Corynebacterium lemuris]MCS5479015.1 electron transfer flavoprotein subunit beta/FixA family protein [Corynebacterium lemuris]